MIKQNFTSNFCSIQGLSAARLPQTLIRLLRQNHDSSPNLPKVPFVNPSQCRPPLESRRALLVVVATAYDFKNYLLINSSQAATIVTKQRPRSTNC